MSALSDIVNKIASEVSGTVGAGRVPDSANERLIRVTLDSVDYQVGSSIADIQKRYSAEVVVSVIGTYAENGADDIYSNHTAAVNEIVGKLAYDGTNELTDKTIDCSVVGVDWSTDYDNSLLVVTADIRVNLEVQE